MAVTLAQAKLNVVDPVDVSIIDEFQKGSDPLNRITFDDVVSAAGNGAALSYGYTRQLTQRSASFRGINSEYVPTEITKVRASVDLKPLGGSFQIDRVLNRVAAQAETAFQMRELLKATNTKFCDAFINGDVSVDANGFDGISKIVTGSTTEYLPANNGVTAGFRDWTTVTTQAQALNEIAVIDDWLAAMDATPDVIYGPGKALRRLKVIAGLTNFYVGQKDEFGRPVDSYNGIPFVDLRQISGANTDIIPLVTRTLNSTSVTNLADFYAIRFGLDGVHGVSMAGGPLVQHWDPDFAHAGAVKTGEVEMGPVAIVVKRTKSAAVLRNVKVA